MQCCGLLVRFTPVIALCLLAAACTGDITVPPPFERPPTPPEPPPPPFAPAPPGLERLTRVQYVASVQQVFGAQVMVPPLEPDTYSYHFANIGASDTSIGPSSAELYDTAALSIAKQVAPRAAANLCSGGAADSCPERFVRHYGRLLWRRPLDDDEAKRLTNLVEAGTVAFGDPDRGYERALAAMLSSPFFLYRVELGDGGRYSGLELATRLSFFLWSSTPDEQLLDAAVAGELDTDEGLAAQTDRLLQSPRARAALLSFFAEHLALDRLTGLQKPAFPNSTPTLGAAMRRELELTIDDVVFEQRADVRHVFDTEVSFVDDELAQLYGLMPVNGWTRITRPATDPRLGLLTTAGFLAMTSGQRESSPTLRGKFLELSVLCEEIPPPPPGVVTELPPAQPGETTRERSERHQTVAQCAGCHSRMDPLGYALEAFDALGGHRTLDNGKPVNTATVISGTPVADARGLASLLAAHQAVGPCLARELYRYATGHVNLVGEDVVLLGVAKDFAAAGYRFDALARSIVLSDGFRKAGLPR